jgi:hypothetical protein
VVVPVVVVVVVVVAQAPSVSPWRMCAGHAWTLTLIVTPGRRAECVLWQIVTLPVAGTVVVPVVVWPVTRGPLAKPVPTMTPVAASTAAATAHAITPLACRSKRLRSFFTAPSRCRPPEKLAVCPALSSRGS